MNAILWLIVFFGVTLPLIVFAWPLIAAVWIGLGVIAVLSIIGTIIMEWNNDSNK